MIVFRTIPWKVPEQNSAYRHHIMEGAFGNEGALRFFYGDDPLAPKSVTGVHPGITARLICARRYLRCFVG
jgi:hypothetical protein